MSKCYVNILLIHMALFVVAIILLLLDGTDSLTGPVPLDYVFLRRDSFENGTKTPNATRVNLTGVPGLPGCSEDPYTCSAGYDYRRFVKNCSFGGGSVLFGDSDCHPPMNDGRLRLFCCNVFLFVKHNYDDELMYPMLYHGCRYAFFGLHGLGIFLCAATLILFYKRQTPLMRKMGIAWLLLILLLGINIGLASINFRFIVEDNKGFQPLQFMVGGGGVVLIVAMFSVVLLKGVIQKQEYYSHPCFVSLGAWFVRKAHEWSLLKFFMSEDKNSKRAAKAEAKADSKEGQKAKEEEPAEVAPEPSVSEPPPKAKEKKAKSGGESKAKSGGESKAKSGGESKAKPAGAKPAGTKPAGAKPAGAKNGGSKPTKK